MVQANCFSGPFGGFLWLAISFLVRGRGFEPPSLMQAPAPQAGVFTGFHHPRVKERNNSTKNKAGFQ